MDPAAEGHLIFSGFRAAFQQRSTRSTRRVSLALSASPATKGFSLKSVPQSTLPPLNMCVGVGARAEPLVLAQHAQVRSIETLTISYGFERIATLRRRDLQDPASVTEALDSGPGHPNGDGTQPNFEGNTLYEMVGTPGPSPLENNRLIWYKYAAKQFLNNPEYCQ